MRLPYCIGAVVGFTVFLLMLLPSGGCTPAPMPAPRVDAALAQRLAEKYTALGPRPAGSEANAAQARSIVQDLLDLTDRRASVAPDYLSPLPAGVADDPSVMRNVIGILPGRSADFYLIGAHFDTKKMATFTFSGANDGASGVAALLSMASAVARSGQTPPYTLYFVFFDGEECLEQYSDTDGLHGSRSLAARWAASGRLKQCRGMFLLDMIGDRDLNIILPKNGDPALTGRILNSARRLGHESRFQTTEMEILDDHVPFLRQGLPTVDLIDFEYGPNHVFWHSPSDTIDKISGGSIKIAADTVLDAIWNP